MPVPPSTDFYILCLTGGIVSGLVMIHCLHALGVVCMKEVQTMAKAEA
jgi:hypothetical protein